MSPPDIHLYLASASPRRAELLEQIGVRYRQLSSDIDETPLSNETAQAYVERLALAKARTARASLTAADGHPVLGADTAVVIDDRILGKPRDRDDGLAMLAQLSGGLHYVYSAVAMLGQYSRVCCSISRVYFRPLSAVEREQYWATGEPADKAGG